MNITNMPTGNLYKFCAIFGISIIFCAAFFFHHTEQTHRAAYITEKRNFVEMRYVTANLKSEILPLLDKRDKGVIDHENFMKRIDVMYKELRGLSTLVKDHQVATEQINFLYDDLERARSLMYFSLIFGCLLSGYGFYNWRNTTQKIEDMQQAIEVIDAHNKIKNELS